MTTRTAYFGNNILGLRILRWLRERDESIVGLVVHPPAKRKFGDELIEAAGLPKERVVLGSRLRAPDVIEQVRLWEADIAVSVLFDYILKPDIIESFPMGVVNLHPALLPWNRGQYPNVWSIVEGTPAGTTLHYIDAGVDTGPIIDQQEVVVDPVDTGETLYRKLEDASFEVFTRSWDAIKEGRASQTPQPSGGTSHRTRDVDAIDRIDLDRTYRAGDLINILRARTFPPYAGAYFEASGRKISLRLRLSYDDQAEDGGRVDQ